MDLDNNIHEVVMVDSVLILMLVHTVELDQPERIRTDLVQNMDPHMDRMDHFLAHTTDMEVADMEDMVVMAELVATVASAAADSSIN